MQHDQQKKACMLQELKWKTVGTAQHITKIKFCYNAIRYQENTVAVPHTLHLSLHITMQTFGGRYCIRLILDGAVIPTSVSVLLVFCNTSITSCLASQTELLSEMCVGNDTCIFKN